MENEQTTLAIEIGSNTFPIEDDKAELILMFMLNHETKHLELIFNIDEATLSPASQAVFNISKKILAENLGTFFMLFREVNKGIKVD